MPPKKTSNKIVPNATVKEIHTPEKNNENTEENDEGMPGEDETPTIDINTVEQLTNEINLEDKDRNSVKSDASIVKSKELPPTCKACFIAFAEKSSPVCNHQFCLKCYKKLQTKTSIEPLEKQEISDKNDEEIWEFKCSLCSKTCETRRQRESKSDTAIHEKASKHLPIKEIHGKGVKRSGTVQIDFAEFAKDADFVPTKFAVSYDGMVAAVDKSSKQVFIFDVDGKVENQFQYLNTHDFQGGLTFARNGLLLIGLKGEKYSCVAFYQTNGKFEYSAFLDDDFSAQLIVAVDNEDVDQEYVVFDETKRKVVFINGQKLVYRTIELESSKEQWVVTSYEGYVYSLVAENQLLLRKLDEDGNTLDVVVDSKVPVNLTNDVTLAVDNNENIIVIDKANKNIHHLSKDAKFLGSLLKFEPQEGAQFLIVDVLLDRQTLRVLTHLTDTENKEIFELRSFTFSTPKKFLKRAEISKEEEGGKSETKSKCCIIL